MNKKNDIQTAFAKEVADKFIKAMEEGTSIFHLGWEKRAPLPPMNPTTGNTYSGVNFLNLALSQDMMGDPRWLTYKQAAAIGGQVKKGEKGTKILYWKTHNLVDRKDSNGKPVIDANGNKVKDKVKLPFPRAFYSTVFNASQIDGIEPFIAPEEDLSKINSRAEKMIMNTGADIRIGGNRAYYKPSTDHIQMPPLEQFKDEDTYISCLTHEAAHWTGHHSRLDRDLTGSKGDESYAREELRAELSSYMLNLKLGVKYDSERHQGYINSWVKVLKNDPQEIIRASATAEKISEYLLSFDRGVSILHDSKLVNLRFEETKNKLEKINEALYANPQDLTPQYENYCVRSKEAYQLLQKAITKDVLIQTSDFTYEIYVYKTVENFENNKQDLIVRGLDDSLNLTYRVGGELDALEKNFVKRDPQGNILDTESLLENIKASLLEYGLDKKSHEIKQDYFEQVENLKASSKPTLFEGAKPEDYLQDVFKQIQDTAKKQFNYSVEFSEDQNSFIFYGSHNQKVSTTIKVNPEGLIFSSQGGEHELLKETSNLYEVDQALIKHLERDQNHTKELIKKIYQMSTKFDGDRSFLKKIATNKITSDLGKNVIDTLVKIEDMASKNGLDTKYRQIEDAACFVSFEKEGNLLPRQATINLSGEVSIDLDSYLAKYSEMENYKEIIEDSFKGSKTSEEVKVLAGYLETKGLNLRLDNWRGNHSATAIVFNDNGEILPTTVSFEKEGIRVLHKDKTFNVADLNLNNTESEVNNMSKPLIAKSRIYLNVSFDEKDKASSMGARWDGREGIKAWYVPTGGEYEKLVETFGKLSDRQNEASKDPVEQFKQALAAAGLMNDNIVADGKIHRVPAIDDKSGKHSGAYALHLNQQIPGGFIQNHKTGEKINWRADVVVNELTEAQKIELQNQANEAREMRAKETKLMNDKTANIAQLFWREAKPVLNNEYCTKKGISNTEPLKIVPEEVSQSLKDQGVRIVNNPMEYNVIKNAPENKDKDLHIFIKDSLLIPAVNAEGDIRTIQQVNNIKSFMKGGEKTGNFITTDGKPVNSKEIILAEGYATADAVSQITGKQVVASFDVGNLEQVALSLREKNPEAKIIIAADNDHIKKVVNGKELGNIGVEKANHVAAEINAIVIIPPFAENDKGTDWNDLLLEKGLIEAKSNFNNQVDRKIESDLDLGL